VVISTERRDMDAFCGGGRGDGKRDLAELGGWWVNAPHRVRHTEETMAKFTWEHVHLRSPDPEATARWYEDKLGAEVIRTQQPDGSNRIDLNLSGQKVFIALAHPGKAAEAPSSPYMGLDHFGMTVDDIDAAVAELKGKGVAFTMDPTSIRPGVKIAFLTAPQNVSIELIQRG
jgi:catechol 2,3-dioxygenase-like lactoylglutathione lyase family enzyme